MDFIVFCLFYDAFSLTKTFVLNDRVSDKLDMTWKEVVVA
jgi:hypothetical protein